MDIRKLQRIIVDALVEIKGKDIVVFNTEKLTDQFSRAVFAPELRTVTPWRLRKTSKKRSRLPAAA